jgi:hypothetical protein
VHLGVDRLGLQREAGVNRRVRSMRLRSMRHRLRAAGAALLLGFWVGQASAAAPNIRLRRPAENRLAPPAAAPAPVASDIGRPRSRLPRGAALRPRPLDPAGPVPTASAVPEPPAPPTIPDTADDRGVARPSSGDDFSTGVDVLGSVGFVRRSLNFYQDVYGRLRTLDENLFVYRLDAAVYPAFRSLALDGRLGLIAGYEGAFSGEVRDGDFGARFPASHSELFGGLRVRRPVQGHVLGFDLTLGRLASGLDDGPALAGTPDVRYGFIRASLDLSVHLGPVRTTLAAAFRLPLSYGEIGEAEWFPRMGGYGVDAVIGASYPLSDLTALVMTASMRRFVLEMNSEPEDGSSGISEVAGGAVDSFIGMYAGVIVAL